MLALQQANCEECINSGQVFLWEKKGETWYGIDGENILAIRENPFQVNSLTDSHTRFFRSDDNIKKILNEICRDDMVSKAVSHSPGLRIFRQNPFQCYVSFIVSSNSNIQNIRNSLQNLCKKFGKKVMFQQKEFHLFPEPEKLAKASDIELRNCGLGYRAEFVNKAAKEVSSGRIDLEQLKKKNYQEVKKSLMEVCGIGNKVADCIMLFSLEKLESFPLDRWMIRILQKYYPNNFNFKGKTITEKKYSETQKKCVKYFGAYAGYAQQFLFKMERDQQQKKWL